MKFKHWFISIFTVTTSLLWSQLAMTAPPFSSPPGLEIASQVQETYGPQLLETEGVVGHGLSIGENGVVQIVVFTEFPMMKGIPRNLNGVKITPEFTGRFYALGRSPCSGPPSQRPEECFSEISEDPTLRYDSPIPIGVSAGHPDITAGTLGARVVAKNPDSTTEEHVYALSNNHVFADSNAASIGDPIIQPGDFDGGSSPNDDFATLYASKDIDFGTGSMNKMDAAIALVNGRELGFSTLNDGYGAPTDTVTEAMLGLKVQKYGRTTGFTQGDIDAIEVTVTVCYAGTLSCTLSATFQEQMRITPGTFSDGGDSGSLIVTQNGNNPVGLLFAGSSSYTIASPIQPVLDEFGVKIDVDTTVEPPTNLTLTTNGYKVKGVHFIDLAWNSAEGNFVIRRNGEDIATVENSDAYTDAPGTKGGMTYTYQVCGTITNVCSNSSTVYF